LAGPVVAGAVILCEGGVIGLNDSKKLSESKRISLEAEIKSQCRWSIGMATPEEIDAINILQATMLAMTRAVEGLLPQLHHPESQNRHPELVSGPMTEERSVAPWMLNQVQHDDEKKVMDIPVETPVLILVDGNRLPKWRWPARAIIGGDASEPAISAASIIAKQARDVMMIAADRAHPGYGFAQHKGYGTAAHLAALQRLGPCPIHRRSFAPVRHMVMASQ
ncbi:MAG: ribonuclease HII, partial [Sphingopyxis sp.]